MRSIAWFVGGLAAALGLQLLGARLFPDFPRALDLFLVVAVLPALDGRTLPALSRGVVVGLLADALSGGLYGLYGLADMVVAYVAALTAQRIVVQRAPGVFLLFALASLLQQAVLLAVSLLLAPGTAAALSLPWALIRAAMTGVAGVVVRFGQGLAGRRLARWRRSRYSRVRLS